MTPARAASPTRTVRLVHSRLGKLNAPKRVSGTGDIKVNVRPERMRTGASKTLPKPSELALD
jgi:hypothetical protein